MNKTRVSSVKPPLMGSLLPFVFLALTASTVVAERPRSLHSSPKPTTVLVLGDSLSAGYGLKRSDAYPALLARKAAAAGLHLDVINAGVSGDTTAGALRRLPPLLRHHVDVLVVELGINDAFRGVPISQMEANLQKIIDLTEAPYPEVRVVIAGMRLPENSGDNFLNAFGAMYADLAKRNHAALVPFLLEGVIGNPTLNLSDLIHPNATGQKVLAANVWPVLESVLRKG